jgi:patatin-like phospholipase/acyl hydrolase
LELEADATLASDNVCKTFVISATTPAADTPFIMRTYDTRTTSASKATIWEAGRATSAAPAFIDPVLIEGCSLLGLILIEGHSYRDGGIVGWNSLATQAIVEAYKIWPDRQIGCLLSIGTGIEKTIQSDRIKDEENYFRFDISQGMSEIGLKEWEKMSDVIDLTQAYMEHWSMKGRRLKVAKLLLNPQSAG